MEYISTPHGRKENVMDNLTNILWSLKYDSKFELKLGRQTKSFL